MRQGFTAVLLVLGLTAAGCGRDISPDRAYCEQTGQTARIIDVDINKAQIKLEKSFLRDNGMIVAAAMDAADGSAVGEFRVYPKKKKCAITTYSNGESATYRIK